MYASDGLTVTLMRNTFAECSVRGETIKLRGQRIRNARRLKGGW